MNIRKLFAVLIIVCAAIVSASAQTEKSPRRIVFARGAAVGRASGYLRGMRDRLFFVVRLNSRQHIRVEIDARGATRGTLIWPSGKQEGGPGGVIFDGDTDETGDYKISVGESMMADPWRGPITVKVEALPRGQASPSDANLVAYIGKYPSDLFRRVPAIKTRLRQLLGANYQDFTDRMQVEAPFENDRDVLITRGCMAHSCTIEEALLAIDMNDGSVYVALKMNGRISRTFPAKRSLLPDALKRAMAQ
ncbi:MAG TPA: hypothetical protein VE969_05535 [Pyrinomonadaceae bacterium]|nr:hypothetical protein [Pyrinomonadaceae bacterium]